MKTLYLIYDTWISKEAPLLIVDDAARARALISAGADDGRCEWRAVPYLDKLPDGVPWTVTFSESDVTIKRGDVEDYPDALMEYVDYSDDGVKAVCVIAETARAAFDRASEIRDGILTSMAVKDEVAL